MENIIIIYYDFWDVTLFICLDGCKRFVGAVCLNSKVPFKL